MLKTRIILVIISVALVVGFYALPKVVVDNDSGEVEETSDATGPTENSSDPDIQAHQQEIQADDATRIKQLRSALDVAQNTEKSIIFADSLAILYERNNLFDSAAMFIEVIAQAEPGTAIWRRAGNMYYEAFTYTIDEEQRKQMALKARTYFEKVLEADTADYEVKNRLAMTLLSTESPMEGIMMLRQIVEEDPDNEQALFNLGALSMQSNQFDKAVERFERVIELNPENLQAQFFLGVSYYETGKMRKAREQFELVKSLDADPEVEAAVDSYLENL